MISKKQILIVDNIALIVINLSKRLEHEGFSPENIITAYSFEEAEKMLEKTAFDLVISDLDYGTSPYDGLLLLKRMRAGDYDEKNIKTPFLLMSGKAYKEIKKELEKFPLTKFIKKPIIFECILVNVRQMLSDIFRGSYS